jgi:hypothetical protein
LSSNKLPPTYNNYQKNNKSHQSQPKPEETSSDRLRRLRILSPNNSTSGEIKKDHKISARYCICGDGEIFLVGSG